MGYTHYYYTRKEFDTELFKKVSNDFKKLIVPLEHLGVKLGDAHGEDRPILTDTEICFNGLRKCGHTERDLGITWPSKTAQGVAKLDYQHRNGNETKQDVNGSWFAGAQLETRTCDGDCSHETFSLEQKMSNIPEYKQEKADQNKRIFECTKTAYKPYDLAVTACLIIAKHHLGNEIIIHSDGELKDFQDAINLIEHFLGYGLEFKLNDPGIKELEKQEESLKPKQEAVKIDKTKISVNDVYSSSWGYDQTNIDFYKVLSISPTKKSCKIIRISSKTIEQINSMVERVIPDPDNIILDTEWINNKPVKVKKEYRALIKTDKDGSIWLRCGQVGGGYLWKYDNIPNVATHYA